MDLLGVEHQEHQKKLQRPVSTDLEATESAKLLSKAERRGQDKPMSQARAVFLFNEVFMIFCSYIIFVCDVFSCPASLLLVWSLICEDLSMSVFPLRQPHGPWKVFPKSERVNKSEDPMRETQQWLSWPTTHEIIES